MTRLRNGKIIPMLSTRTSKRKLCHQETNIMWTSRVHLSPFHMIWNTDVVSRQEGQKENRKGEGSDPKAGADVGKIVNLMAGEPCRFVDFDKSKQLTNHYMRRSPRWFPGRTSSMEVSSLIVWEAWLLNKCLIAPFEIVIAGIFLYQLVSLHL